MTKFLTGHLAGHTEVCPHCNAGAFRLDHLHGSYRNPPCKAYQDKLNVYISEELEILRQRRREEERMLKEFIAKNPNWFARLQHDLMDYILFYYGCLQSYNGRGTYEDIIPPQWSVIRRVNSVWARKVVQYLPFASICYFGTIADLRWHLPCNLKEGTRGSRSKKIPFLPILVDAETYRRGLSNAYKRSNMEMVKYLLLYVTDSENSKMILAGGAKGLLPDFEYVLLGMEDEFILPFLEQNLLKQLFVVDRHRGGSESLFSLLERFMRIEDEEKRIQYLRTLISNGLFPEDYVRNYYLAYCRESLTTKQLLKAWYSSKAPLENPFVKFILGSPVLQLLIQLDTVLRDSRDATFLSSLWDSLQKHQQQLPMFDLAFTNGSECLIEFLLTSEGVSMKNSISDCLKHNRMKYLHRILDRCSEPDSTLRNQKNAGFQDALAECCSTSKNNETSSLFLNEVFHKSSKVSRAWLLDQSKADGVLEKVYQWHEFNDAALSKILLLYEESLFRKIHYVRSLWRKAEAKPTMYPMTLRVFENWDRKYKDYRTNLDKYGKNIFFEENWVYKK